MIAGVFNWRAASWNVLPVEQIIRHDAVTRHAFLDVRLHHCAVICEVFKRFQSRVCAEFAQAAAVVMQYRRLCTSCLLLLLYPVAATVLWLLDNLCCKLKHSLNKIDACKHVFWPWLNPVSISKLAFNCLTEKSISPFQAHSKACEHGMLQEFSKP
jgi:hypothetical protein